METERSFKDNVLDVVAKIPKGEVLTYKQVAKHAGSPRAYRAVGNILNKNRSTQIPCHRVIKSDGDIGGFAFGTAKKANLLALEGASNNTGIILNPDFFNRPTLEVAENLLGKYLVRKVGNKKIELQITEVEAYDGPKDKACHACKGLTPRTEVMFGPAGHFYLYFCYGVHWMLNIVTGEVSYPSAVLIRGAGDISGPGRLTKHLKINKSLNKKIAHPNSGLWFEDRGQKPLKKDIQKGPHIGVAYAGPVWSKKPYRFLLKNHS